MEKTTFVDGEYKVLLVQDTMLSCRYNMTSQTHLT